jgi:hypothetical protein
LSNRIVKFDQYIEEAESDTFLTAQRLLGKDDEIYQVFNRYLSEASLRLNLTVPIGFLSLVFAYRWSPWFSAGILLSVALLLVGHQSYLEAKRVVAVALWAGRISNPIFDRLQADRMSLIPAEEILEQQTASMPAK